MRKRKITKREDKMNEEKRDKQEEKGKKRMIGKKGSEAKAAEVSIVVTKF